MKQVGIYYVEVCLCHLMLINVNILLLRRPFLGFLCFFRETNDMNFDLVLRCIFSLYRYEKCCNL